MDPLVFVINVPVEMPVTLSNVLAPAAGSILLSNTLKVSVDASQLASIDFVMGLAVSGVLINGGRTIITFGLLLNLIISIKILIYFRLPTIY